MFFYKLAKLIGFILLLLTITTVHIFFTSVLPEPFVFVHVIIASLICYLFLFENGSVVWLSFLLFFFLDAYSAGTPFGVLLLSGTIATLCVYWLYERIFTNRSWYSGLALTAICIVLFRALYFMLRFIVSVYTDVPLSFVRLSDILLWELVLTPSIMAIVVAIVTVSVPSLRVRSKKELFTLSRRSYER